MSLYDYLKYLKTLGIDKEHTYTVSMTEPTDFPRKVGHDANIDMIAEDLATTISDEECSVCMVKSNTLRSAIYI